MASPTAIISYTHDSDTHMERVLEFAQWLRRNGIDCKLDRYVDPTDWPEWMERQIRECDWTIVIATQTYNTRSRNDAPMGVGLGGSWEYAAIRRKLYESRGGDERVIPCVFEAADIEHIPDALKVRTHYDLGVDAQKTTVLHKMAGLPITVTPDPVGDLPVVSGGMRVELTTNTGRVVDSVTAEVRHVDRSIQPRLSLSLKTEYPPCFAFGNGPVHVLGSHKLRFEVQNRGKGAANKVRLVMSGSDLVGKLATLMPGDDPTVVTWNLEEQPAYRLEPQYPLVRVEYQDDAGTMYAQIAALNVKRQTDGTLHYASGNFEAPEVIENYTIGYDSVPRAPNA